MSDTEMSRPLLLGIRSVPRSSARREPASGRTPKTMQEWPRLWKHFQYDTYVATNSLIYLLDRTHSINSYLRRLTEQTFGSDPPGPNTDLAIDPAWPTLEAFPTVMGAPLLDRSELSGQLGQMAFKGWITEVYDGLWERRYRTAMKRIARVDETSNPIRPRQQVLGDLGYIRNDFIHGGVADRSRRCEVLRWFKEGEEVQLQFRHVLDFLNQMRWLTSDLQLIPVTPGLPVRGFQWEKRPSTKAAAWNPKLASFRPIVDPDVEPQFRDCRYGISVVFENGVYGRIAYILDEPGPEKDRMWEQMRLADTGDIEIPGMAPLLATHLYEHCLSGKTTKGPGEWSPAVQFAEQKRPPRKSV